MDEEFSGGVQFEGGFLMDKLLAPTNHVIMSLIMNVIMLALLIAIIVLIVRKDNKEGYASDAMWPSSGRLLMR